MQNVLELRGIGSAQKQPILLEKARQIKRAAGLDLARGQLGVRPSDLPDLIKKGLNDLCMGTTPRRANRRYIEVVYGKSL